MPRPVRFAAVLPLLACLAASPGAARAAATCAPALALAAPDAVPSLLTVRPDAGRVHFLKDSAAAQGCPGPAPYCLDPGFVGPGDAVVVTGTAPGYVCATVAGAAGSVPVSGWLPRSALGTATAATAAPADWTGEWQSGPEQSISIAPAPGGGIALRGMATFGGRDPARVKRGAVNTGTFDAVLPAAGGSLAFLVGGDGNPLPYDAARAQAETLCALRLWRLGPYLIAADNLQCGGANVTFTGVYRRAGKAP